MQDLIDRALAEDLGDGDLTGRVVVPAGARARAEIRQKGPGVLAGLDVARAVFERGDPGVRFTAAAPEGEWRDEGRVGDVGGEGAGILAA